MIKIRLMRIGSKKRPFYRVVAVDERQKRDGAYLELLGTYNPLTEPKEINVDQKLVENWIKKGAVLSDGYLRIIGKAPERPPRKPKKAKPEVASTDKVEEAPVEEVSQTETPIEEETTEATNDESPAETAKEIQEEEVKEETATTDEPESDKAEAVEEEK